MQQVFRAVGRLSRSSMTVLITGESGTGKELVARALHRHSPRSSKAFVALNTAAFTADLLESELFGHEKGAFTGADALRRGRFEQADGGTLFLDEIGDMSPALQTRLLRVLAEGEFYRVGGQTPVKVDVRVIAATHQDLEARVKSGHFREDLLHRLNVIRIEIPPLRERREDIPELLRHYLAVAGQELGVEPKLLTGARGDRAGHVRLAGQRAAAGQCLPPPDGHRAGARDPRRGHSARSRRRCRRAAGRTTTGWRSCRTGRSRSWSRHAAPARPGGARGGAHLDPRRAAQGRRPEAGRREALGWGRNTLTRKMKELGMEDVA